MSGRNMSNQNQEVHALVDSAARSAVENEQNDGSELHFRRGTRGKLARFILARHTAGDPFDATVVLPCVVLPSLALRSLA